MRDSDALDPARFLSRRDRRELARSRRADDRISDQASRLLEAVADEDGNLDLGRLSPKEVLVIERAQEVNPAATVRAFRESRSVVRARPRRLRRRVGRRTGRPTRRSRSPGSDDPSQSPHRPFGLGLLARNRPGGDR